MGKLGWTIAASIGPIVILQPALAASDARAPLVVSAQRSVSPSDDPKYLMAQSAEPKDSATPASDSKKPQDQSSVPASSPPTETAAVPTAEKTVPGCALKYMAAELSGKLKGRKWKEFRQQDCGPGTAQVVFPAMVAPKYSGEDPEKARTLTCADQFTANKATNGNGGLKWIEKSGGYYSECVVRLKG
jgi:cell division septation protein DedD